MRRLLVLAVPVGLALAATSLPLTNHSETDQRVTASEKCVYTQDTYVLGQKVLSAGKYCVPWI